MVAASILLLALSSISPPAVAASFENIVTNYNGYDLDSDGVNEINLLRFLWYFNHSFDQPSDPVNPDAKLVVVLVEASLINNLPQSRYSVSNLLSGLVRLGQDLAVEGRQARFLVMGDYSGARIQEGKTLLAIREFFKSVYSNFSNFEGALLVGPFPDAGIVRTWPGYPPDTGGKFYTVGLTSGKPRPHDIVLADLDGNWRDLYYENSTSLTGWTFQVTNTTTVRSNGSLVLLTNAVAIAQTSTRRDFFWLRDANYTVFNAAKGQVQLDLACANPEANAGDKTRPNPIARPEISISRINPRSIALQPPSSRLLDANGRPHSVPNVPFINLAGSSWPRDPNLERTLLVEYLDLNHAFRSGRYASQPFSVSLAWCDIGTVAADEGLAGLVPREANVHVPFLPDYVQWLKRPTLFRAVAAHSDASLSLFPGDRPSPDPVDYAALKAACGGYPWLWIEMNGYYVPSFQGVRVAGLNLHRTLYENKVLTNLPPSLMVHVGCNVAGVDFGDLTHNDSQYGFFQNAASLLFYTRQLAILCRVTDWNRGPFGFGSAFNASPSAVMGDGWKGMSAYMSQDTSWFSTQRKQNYIWNLVGDYTLKKYYSARPANDEWPGAIPLVANVPYTMSTLSATSVSDPVPSCLSTPVNGVWFKFTPASSRVVTVNTCASGFDTVLQAYVYSAGNLVPVVDGCNDDSGDCGTRSRVAFPATAGTTYYLLAGGYNGVGGSLNITASEVPLAIARQPSSEIADAGDAVAFGVMTAGSDPCYQWQRGGVNLSSATSSTLTLENVAPAMAGEYRVIVTNAYGAVTSSVATLIVKPALDLALETTNLVWTTGGGNNADGWFRQTDVFNDGVDSAECGAPESFPPYSTAWMQTTVTGPAALGFYWRFYKPISSRSGDYLGFFLDGVYQAGTSSFFVSFAHKTVYLGAGNHTVRWQYVRAGSLHGGGPGNVDEVSLTPGATPAFIVDHPVSQATVAGSNATFTVAASGTPPFTYQWQFNGVSLSSATNSALIFTNAQPSQAGSYRVLVANGYGSPLLSSAAALTVATVPLPIAVDFAGPPWSTSGNTPWFGQINQPYDGVDAAQSGWITHTQRSTLTAQLAGPGHLSFWWKVSSETNYDLLRFYINDVLETNISGEVAWRRETFPLLPGKQTVTWTYSKDTSINVGQDAGWVDQVTYDGRPYLSWKMLSQEQAVFRWPSSVTGYTLQMTPDLRPPIGWQTVTNPVSSLGDDWIVTNASPGPQQFYRLKK
jgi:hypothetical protein